jgi:hydrogenase maturation protease
MRTIILGLGNPILGDDGVGCKIAEEIGRRLTTISAQNIDVEPFYRGGIALMERLVDYDRAFLIDSIEGLGAEPGTIHRLGIDDLPTLTADSAHDASLKAALEMGKRLGVKLPASIVIFAVEIVPQVEFSENLSPKVQESVEKVVKMVIYELCSLMGK